MIRRALIVALFACLAQAGFSDGIRIATYQTELTRRGPGLLLKDILDRDEQVVAVADVITRAAPDVILLTGFDHDTQAHALTAFAALLAETGVTYPYQFTARPNAGVPADVDLDGDGYDDGPRDAQGYGRFTGQGGMAVLSRLPIGEVRSFTEFLWKDLPGNIAPMTTDGPFPSSEAREVQRLSSVAHWDVPIEVDGRIIHLFGWHGSTPVFDGPEDLNGRRGADEARFWQLLLDGALPFDPPKGPVVLAGVSNIDPVDGDGRREVMQGLLADPRLTDPTPSSTGGVEAANPKQAGNAALDTADFDDPTPGNLRVDYVLPGAGLTVAGAGVLWPTSDDPFAETVALASRHRLVWVDVLLP